MYLHEHYINNRIDNAFFPADNVDAVASKILSKLTKKLLPKVVSCH